MAYQLPAADQRAIRKGLARLPEALSIIERLEAMGEDMSEQRALHDEARVKGQQFLQHFGQGAPDLQ